MKIVIVGGTRPNFMKIAPLIRAIGKHNKLSDNTIELLFVHTGQHYDYEMSQIFFKDLQLPKPDVYLNIGSGSHAEQTGRIMIQLESTLINYNPDIVTVVGDVNSTLAAALTAVKLHIPVAHVEAGLRSYDRNMPEEINRIITDHIADYLFTTSELDDENLVRENIAKERIFCVGNIMADSLFYNKKAAQKSEVLSRFNLKENQFALVTLHRPSNVDDEQTLSRIIKALKAISKSITVVFPIHPRTKRNIEKLGISNVFSDDRILLIEPQGYNDFLKLEMRARLVITDSGGVQVETAIFDTPCLTILPYQVWPITHMQGNNKLVGSDPNELIQEVERIINRDTKASFHPKYWDGKTAARIIKILCS